MADYFPTVGPTGSISFTSIPLSERLGNIPPVTPMSVGWNAPAGTSQGSYIGWGAAKRRGKKEKAEETKEEKEKAKSDWLKKRFEEIEAKGATGKDIKELVSKARVAQAEQRLKEIESRRSPPKGITPKKWLSDPDKLKWAVKRGMVKMIAKHANPESKDTENVFTIAGKRYALTDAYKAPITERIGDIKTRTEVGTTLWWDRNKTTVFVLGAGAVAAYVFYNWYQRSELEKRLGRARARAHGHTRLASAAAAPAGGHASGYYPFELVPYSQFDPPASFGAWQRPETHYFYHSPLARSMEYPFSGYRWW